ncbi:MAG: hypothetical protein PVS2B2_06110 [Candidatus Acidiferrum sp.]
MDTERRKTPRTKPEQLIYVEFAHKNGGMVRDFSEDGMGFRCVGPVQHGQKVQFSFSFHAELHLDGEAELIWTDAEGKAGGLRFLNLEGEGRTQIRDWIAGGGYSSIASEARAAAATMPRNTLEELRKELHGESTSAVVEEPAAVPEAIPDELPDECPEGASIGETSPYLPPLAIPEMNPPAPMTPAFEKKLSFSQQPLIQESQETKWMENVTLGWVFVSMLILTTLTASFVYHYEVGKSLIWLGEKIGGDEIKIPAPIVPPKEPRVPLEAAHSPATNADTDAAPPVKTIPENRQPPRQAASPVKIADDQVSTDDSGQREFQQAAQILRDGDHLNRLPEAVRLLWAAVGKGNSAAELALAGLYRRGEGVSQSCNQARVLLTAAAKKGNILAQDQLDDLDRTGCP